MKKISIFALSTFMLGGSLSIANQDLRPVYGDEVLDPPFEEVLDPRCPALDRPHGMQLIQFGLAFLHKGKVTVSVSRSEKELLSKAFYPMKPVATGEGCAYIVGGKKISMALVYDDKIMELARAYYAGDIPALKQLEKYFTRGNLADIDGGYGTLTKKYFPPSLPKGDWDQFVKDATENRVNNQDLF